ncbi:tetratricopeptide repeat protein 23-like [Mya arenaria]|uniref:tetratricopeptide repeat protein 23-like n=1 Tax=Mya arenaria TaxID=6604 RepID=UPI0022E93A9B|nr:tetratricopeptide repeat protein 23-like [Mya arenaria]XP_052785686.1 tetratricopeptide repeat protein 23-like [Mya arenaria]
MSDDYSGSDFEDISEDEIDPKPVVVEVRGLGTKGSPVTARRSPGLSHRGGSRASRHRHEDLEESEEEESDEEEYEAVTARGSARRPHSSRNIKMKNGNKSVNMTPPNKLLEKAVKLIEKFVEKGKADRVIQERVKILALTRIVYGSTHWRLAEAHVNLAQDYLELKNFTAQAEYHAENAMQIMLNSVSTTTSEQEKANVFSVLFRLNYIQGKAQVALKKYAEADAAFKKADRAYQASSKLSCVTDDECDDMEIKLAQGRARLSWRQKKYAVAGSEYDKVIDLTKRRYGEDALELIELYQENGRLEQSKGRHANHDKAIEMFLQAHSIAAARYKYASEEIVDTALALAQAYSTTGREEAESSAESYLNECLGSCTAVYGPDHKKTLEVHDELARLLVRSDRQTEAMDILKSSIPLKNEVYGDYSENVADTHKLMASIHLAQGSIEKALRCYKRCLNIEVLVLGKNHKKTKDSERTIDILMASPGLSKKFVLNKDDELKKRPRFNAISKTAKTS